MRWLFCLVAGVLAAGVAAGDEIVLKNGNILVGIARVDGERVVIELRIGTVAVSRDDVSEIRAGRCVLHEYEERLQKLGSSPGAAGLFELAQWARREGVSRHETPLLRRVLALDPDHAEARALLGYERFQGRWMTRIERLKAQGYVEFRARWIKPEERTEILAREAAERNKTRAAPRRSAEREPVFHLGIPPCRGGGSRAYGGSWYLYGTYGPLFGLRRGAWGYHWSGSHTGSYGGKP